MYLQINCINLSDGIKYIDMMESIYIKNFGPIQEVEIKNIPKVTVFIGESGSGKSTIMKVVSLFRWIYKMVNIRSFLKYSGVKKSPFRFSFLNLIGYNGLADFLRTDTEIIYQNGSCRLEWNPASNKLKGTSNYIPKEELSLEKISFISDKRNLISDLIDGNVSIKHNMFYLNETYSDFEKAVQVVREMKILDLGVCFKVKRTSQGLKYMIVSDAESGDFGIKLRESSSGTQNIVPMNIIVEYYSHFYDMVSSTNNAILSYVSKSDSLSDFKAVSNIGDFSGKHVHLFIEEPELSLFPSSQTALMDFLIESVNGADKREYDMSLMLATHSPYIVNYLNVLLRRGLRNENSSAGIHQDDLAVFTVYRGKIQNLLAVDSATGETIVNTGDLNEEMVNIYDEYLHLGGMSHEGTVGA